MSAPGGAMVLVLWMLLGGAAPSGQEAAGVRVPMAAPDPPTRRAERRARARERRARERAASPAATAVVGVVERVEPRATDGVARVEVQVRVTVASGGPLEAGTLVTYVGLAEDRRPERPAGRLVRDVRVPVVGEELALVGAIRPGPALTALTPFDVVHVRAGVDGTGRPIGIDGLPSVPEVRPSIPQPRTRLTSP